MGRIALSLGIVSLSALGALLLTSGSPPPAERRFTIQARQYAYDPHVLRVNRGDTVHIRLVSKDVVHGFYLEGHDIDAEIHPGKRLFKMRRPSSGSDWEWVEEIVFVTEKTGKFRYRCSHTCGYLHPFMLGELFVEPNRLLPVAMALVGGILLGGFVMVWPFGAPRGRGRQGRPGPSSAAGGSREMQEDRVARPNGKESG